MDMTLMQYWYLPAGLVVAGLLYWAYTKYGKQAEAVVKADVAKVESGAASVVRAAHAELDKAVAKVENAHAVAVAETAVKAAHAKADEIKSKLMGG